jgi:hypothetical protein
MHPAPSSTFRMSVFLDPASDTGALLRSGAATASAAEALTPARLS